MKSKIIPLAIVFILFSAGIALFTVSAPENDSPSSSPSDSALTIQEDTDNQQSDASDLNVQRISSDYTIEDVKIHNTKDDCWTFIGTDVYDITPYIPRHPGGDDIVLACGNDGTSLFNSKTTQEGNRVGSGTPHSSRASQQLQQYKIGELIPE